MARRTVLDSFLSTGGLLGRLHLTGDDILAAEATALAANVNLFDKSEAQVASALAGSIVLRAQGGRAYVITEDESLVWGALADGSRCVRFSHPTMNQGLAAGVMRGFHGFLPGAGKTGATFVVRGTSIPAEVVLEMATASAEIVRCVVRAPALFGGPQVMSVEELADLCGLAFAPFDIPVAAVDERQAATIEGARGAVRLALAPGGRTERVLTVLSAAAGVQVVLAGGAVLTRHLVSFAHALCDMAHSRGACIAVGMAAADVEAGRPAGYDLGSMPLLTTSLESALEAAAAEMGGQWDALLGSVGMALAALPQRAKVHTSRVVGSMLRQVVGDAPPPPLSTPGAAVPPLPPIGAAATSGILAAPFPPMVDSVDMAGLSPDGARQLTALLQRNSANKRRALDPSLSGGMPLPHGMPPASLAGGAIPLGTWAPSGAVPSGMPVNGCAPLHQLAGPTLLGTGGDPQSAAFLATFIPLGGESQPAATITAELGGEGTRDSMAALVGRQRRTTLAAGSATSVLKDMITDVAIAAARSPGCWTTPSTRPADWSEARDRLNDFDRAMSAGQLSTTAAGRKAVHKVVFLGAKPTDEAVAQAASHTVLAPLTEQRAFTLEQVASAGAKGDAIAETARICQTHGVSGWASQFSSLQSDAALGGTETADGKAGDSLIPSSIARAHEGLGRWAAEQIGLWNGVGRMKFGSGAAPLSVGMPNSEGAVLTKRALAWALRLQSGMIDQEEGVFLLGGETSPTVSTGGVYLGASPSLGRPGSSPGEPLYEGDYQRFLTRLEFLLAHMFGRGGGGTLDVRVAVPHFGLALMESDLGASGRSLWGEHSPPAARRRLPSLVGLLVGLIVGPTLARPLIGSLA